MTDKEATVFELDFTPLKPSKNSTPAEIERWADNRAFFSCNPEGTKKGFDVIQYLFADHKVEKQDVEQLREEAAERLGLSGTVPDKSQARDIEEYMTRFNTLGAFNLSGTMTKDEVDEWRKGARITKSNFWHGYLSIPFMQSIHMDAEKMQRLCRQTFGKFLKDAGFDPKNVAVLFSVHKDKPHKHFHYVFYEKMPKYLDKHGETQFRWKGKIEQKVLDDYRLSTTAYMDEHKEDFYSYRDRAINLLRNTAGEARSDAELYVMLNNLSDKLPVSGRLQYNSEKIAPYREEIDYIVRAMLKRNPEAWEQHKKALKEIARRGKELKELKGGNDHYAMRMNEEYKSRLGNLVLGLIKQMRFDPKGKAGIKKPQSKKQHKAAARRRHSVGVRVINQFIRTLDNYQAYVRTDFAKDLERAEYEIGEQQKRRRSS